MTRSVALTDDDNSWLSFFSETLTSKLNKLYRSGPALFRCSRTLVKLSGLSRVKVSRFLASKPSYMKYSNRRRKFPRL